VKIRGIGIDLIEIDRISKAYQRWGTRLERRVLTGEEIRIRKSLQKEYLSYLAGRFAAKEAIFKALGHQLNWQDVTVLYGKSGQPTVSLKGKSRNTAKNLGIKNVLVSISHTNKYAVAQAIALSN